MAKLEKNGIQRQIATLGDELPGDSVEDYVAEHGGEGGNPPLPENIVIDPDYVHTDNNYDNDAAEKLAGLQNYDDTAVNEAITSEAERATAAETALQTSINDAIETAANYTEHKTPPYSIVNVIMQYDTDYNNVQLGVSWFYKDTESTQTFYNNIPVADESKTGLIAKEDIQAIRSNTAAAANIPSQLADLLVQAQNYTNDAIDQYSQATFRYVGQAATIADLPSDYAADEHVFELWSVIEDSHGYYWFGGEWNILDFNGVNLDAYSTTAEIEAAVNSALAPLQQWQESNTFVSSSEAGKAYFEQDGTISVYGWGGLTATVATTAAGLQSHTGNDALHVSVTDRTAWNGKQNALNRTIVVDDSTKTAITDTGGNITVPCPIVLSAPTANANQFGASNPTLREFAQRVQDNVAWLFGYKQNRLSRTIQVVDNDNNQYPILDEGDDLQLPCRISISTPNPIQSGFIGKTWTLRNAMQQAANNIQWILNNMVYANPGTLTINTAAVTGWTIAEIQNADMPVQFVRRIRFTNNTGAAAALSLIGVTIASRSYIGTSRLGTIQELKQGGLIGYCTANGTNTTFIAYDYVSGSIANNGAIDLLIRLDK